MSEVDLCSVSAQISLFGHSLLQPKSSFAFGEGAAGMLSRAGSAGHITSALLLAPAEVMAEEGSERQNPPARLGVLLALLGGRWVKPRVDQPGGMRNYLPLGNHQGLAWLGLACSLVLEEHNEHSAHSLSDKGQPQPCLCCAGTRRRLSVN